MYDNIDILIRLLVKEEESEMTTSKGLPRCKQNVQNQNVFLSPVYTVRLPSSSSEISLNAGQETYFKYLLFILQM